MKKPQTTFCGFFVYSTDYPITRKLDTQPHRDPQPIPGRADSGSEGRCDADVDRRNQFLVQLLTTLSDELFRYCYKATLTGRPEIGDSDRHFLAYTHHLWNTVHQEVNTVYASYRARTMDESNLYPDVPAKEVPFWKDMCLTPFWGFELANEAWDCFQLRLEFTELIDEPASVRTANAESTKRKLLIEAYREEARRVTGRTITKAEI